MDALALVKRLLFPSPRPPHYQYDDFPCELIWIPPNEACVAAGALTDIPAVFLTTTPSYKVSSSSSAYVINHAVPGKEDLLIIFCHGNGCDIGSMYDTMKYYRNYWNCYILCIEYPGYGSFEGTPSEASLNATLFSVIEFIHLKCKYPLERIVLFGQSIGTGPVCTIAATYARKKQYFGGIILQSPFTNIKDVVKFLASVASTLVHNRWSSISAMEWIQSPLLIIHGKQDELIPCSHSEQLYNASVSKYKTLLLIETATHNRFDHYADIITPVSEFLGKYLRSRQAPIIMESIRHASDSSPSSTTTTTTTTNESSSTANNSRVVSSTMSDDNSTVSTTSELQDTVNEDEDADLAAAIANSIHTAEIEEHKRSYDDTLPTQGKYENDEGIRPHRKNSSENCEPAGYHRANGQFVPFLRVPSKYYSVPTRVIATHIKRLEESKKEEEDRKRYQERKQYWTDLFKNGKLSFQNWAKSVATITLPEEPPIVDDPIQPPGLSDSRSPSQSPPHHILPPNERPKSPEPDSTRNTNSKP